jgi:hypothetical protein
MAEVKDEKTKEEKPDLGSIFSKKAKRVKSNNLNNNTTTAKAEAKKPGKKQADEDGWEEEQIVAATMNIEVAGNLTRDEDKKEDEDTSAPKWGNLKSKAKGDSSALSEKKFPALAKSVQSSNINIDDGSNPTINIQTSKNAFSALEMGNDSDEELKRPREIKPAMVQKKKGESEKDAIQREVDKYVPTAPKKDSSKKRKKKKSGDADEDDEDDDDDADEEAAPILEEEDTAPAVASEKKKKSEEKKAVEAEAAALQEHEETEEIEDDLKIQPDMDAVRAKYEGRRRLPPVDLPRSELEEEKVTKSVSKSKKNKCVDEEEFYSKGKHLKAAPADWLKNNDD